MKFGCHGKSTKNVWRLEQLFNGSLPHKITELTSLVSAPGGGTTIHSVNAFPTAVLTILTDSFNPKFRGRGHIFPWANAFVGQGQSKFEAPVKKPRC